MADVIVIGGGHAGVEAALACARLQKETILYSMHIDMIASMNEEEVQFEFSTPSRACIMTPMNKKDNEDLLMLVMPIMVNT